MLVSGRLELHVRLGVVLGTDPFGVPAEVSGTRPSTRIDSESFTKDLIDDRLRKTLVVALPEFPESCECRMAVNCSSITSSLKLRYSLLVLSKRLKLGYRVD